MTRRHFEALAEALKSVKPHEGRGPLRCHQWGLDVQTIACVGLRFNPRFNREKFYKACGYAG